MATKAFQGLTSSQVSAITKATKASGGAISASEFNRIIAGPKHPSTTAIKSKSRHPDTFSFVCRIARLSDKQFQIVFSGRHYSKNTISSWPLSKKFSYKTNIKKAFGDAIILNRKAVPSSPFQKVIFEITFCNPRSRDDDNNQETMKIMRDCCTTHKIIKDDNRQVVVETISRERLSKEYSVEILITEVSDDC